MVLRKLQYLATALLLLPALAAQQPDSRNLLSRDLPDWLDLGFTMRTRAERRSNLSLVKFRKFSKKEEGVKMNPRR